MDEITEGLRQRF